MQILEQFPEELLEILTVLKDFSSIFWKNSRRNFWFLETCHVKYLEQFSYEILVEFVGEHLKKIPQQLF